MKKVLSFMFAIMMLVAVASCNSKSAGNDNDSTTTDSAEQVIDTAVDSPIAVPADVPTSDKAE